MKRCYKWLLPALALFVPTASAIDLHFLHYDPVRQLTESDWELESEAFLKAVEETPAGAVTTWKNPETGNSGTITLLNRFQGAAGEECRTIRETFKSKQFDSQYKVNVCKYADQGWKVTGLNKAP